MPLHAFIAFGLFLKIPGYATVMLRNRKQAQCILKLLLGATNNRSSVTSASTAAAAAATLSTAATAAATGGTTAAAAAAAAMGNFGLVGGAQMASKEEDYSLSLSTMPFLSLRDLLADASSSTSGGGDKLALVTFIFENRILTLILSILSNLSHHPHRQTAPHFSCKMIPDNYLQVGHHGAGGGDMLGGHGGAAGFLAASNAAAAAAAVGGAAGGSEDKNSLYWAKGTGFGTGSTMQQWDAEKTLMQQKMEEEHVSCILEVGIYTRFLEFRT